MRKNKMAIATYVVSLVIISFLLSLVFFMFLDIFFSEDIKECYGLNYEYKMECYSGLNYKGTYTNKDEVPLMILINGEEFEIGADRAKVISKKVPSNERFEIVPLAKPEIKDMECKPLDPDYEECKASKESNSDVYYRCDSLKRIIIPEDLRRC